MYNRKNGDVENIKELTDIDNVFFQSVQQADLDKILNFAEVKITSKGEPPAKMSEEMKDVFKNVSDKMKKLTHCMNSFPGHDTSYLEKIIKKVALLFTPSYNGSHNPYAYTTKDLIKGAVEFETNAIIHSFQQVQTVAIKNPSPTGR